MAKHNTLRKILMLFVVVATTLLVGRLINHNRQNLNKEMTKSADTAIIAKVGEKRFHQYFKLDTSASSDAAPNLSHAGIRVYHFSPLKSITDDDQVYVIFTEKDDSTNLAQFIPDCVHDASLCNFNLNRQQVLTIAKNNGIDADDLEISWNTVPDSSRLAIKVKSCKQNKSIWIDYRNGQIAGSEPAKYCASTS